MSKKFFHASILGLIALVYLTTINMALAQDPRDRSCGARQQLCKERWDCYELRSSEARLKCLKLRETTTCWSFACYEGCLLDWKNEYCPLDKPPCQQPVASPTCQPPK